MIDRFADWFAGVLLEKGVITEDELEVQVYGIQTILSNLLSYGVVLAVSWAFRRTAIVRSVSCRLYGAAENVGRMACENAFFLCAVQYCRMGRGGCCLRPLPQRALHCCLQRGRRDAWRLWCKAPCIMPDEEDTLELRRKLRLRTAVVCAVVLGAALLSMWLYSPALRRGAAAAVASVPVVALTMLAGIHAGRNEKE